MFFSRLGDTYLRILNTFLSGIRSSCHESEYLKFFTVRFCRMVHGDFLDRSSFTFYRSEDSYRKDFSFDVSHLRLCRLHWSFIPASPKETSFPFFYRGILYTAGFYLVEFISGSFLKQFGMCPWDYSGVPLQCHGVIRLDYAPLWFTAGLIFEKILTVHR